MPVTKKKGAIFAIYADSPDRPASSATIARTSTSTLKAHANTNTLSSITTTTTGGKSPTKRTIKSQTARKALAALQPSSATSSTTTTKGFPSAAKPPSNSSSHCKVLDENAAPTKHRPAGLSTGKSAPPPIKTAPTKRQLEIFSPSLPSSPPPPSSEHRPAHSSSSRPSKYLASPAKRTRTTPSKARPIEAEKENLPILDSPSSRTRSKTRPNSLTASSSTTATPSRRLQVLLGDGRGTLSLAKGRELASLLAEGEVGPESSDLFGAVSVGEAKDGSTKKGGKGLGKGPSVAADGPLADVSEAYGASGKEPEGFRTARR